MPPNGTCSDSDAAVALAFGRNSVPDSELSNIEIFFKETCLCRESIQEAHLDVIMYLDDLGFDSGEPNYEIAHYIESYIEIYRKPVVAQWELAIALFQIYGKERVKSMIDQFRLIPLWPDLSQNKYGSVHVLRNAYKVFRTLTLSKPYVKPLLIAHDLHMCRVYMLARNIWACPIVAFKHITRVFDFKSVQKQTQDPLRWYAYEFCVRAHHLIHDLV